jgi:hypothetical protein
MSALIAILEATPPIDVARRRDSAGLGLNIAVSEVHGRAQSFGMTSVR